VVLWLSCDCHFPPLSNAKALRCSTWKYSWVRGCSVWQIFLTCSESKTLVWGHFMSMKHLPCLWCKGVSLYGNFFLLFVALGRSASGRKGCHCGCQQFQVSTDPLWSVEWWPLLELIKKSPYLKFFYQIRSDDLASSMEEYWTWRFKFIQEQICSQGDQISLPPANHQGVLTAWTGTLWAALVTTGTLWAAWVTIGTLWATLVT